MMGTTLTAAGWQTLRSSPTPKQSALRIPGEKTVMLSRFF